MSATVTSIHSARDRAELAALRQTAGMPACPKCGNNRQVWRNQITGLITCHRAYCHTVLERSEGTASAQRINSQPESLTGDPLLLHRIDGQQLTDNRAVQVPGAIEQRQCAPGMCQGLPTCNDHACQGHPCNDVPTSERDGPLLAKVLLVYTGALTLCGLAAWQWLSR